MKTCVVAMALLVAALCSARARAQSRVSVEVGGIVSAYDVQSGPASSQSGLRAAGAINGAVVSAAAPRRRRKRSPRSRCARP